MMTRTRTSMKMLAVALICATLLPFVSAADAAADATAADDAKQEQPKQEQQKLDPWRIDTVCDSSNCTYPQMWQGLGCDAKIEEERFNANLFNESTWMLLRGTYQGTMGPTASSLSTHANMEYENDVPTTSGFQVRTYVGFIPGGGKIVYAGQNIAKGTWIWNGDVQGAEIPSAKLFRHFVLSLPPTLGCQMLMRCYPQALADSDDDSVSQVRVPFDSDQTLGVYMMCDFDDASFLGENPNPNVGCSVSNLEEHSSIDSGCPRNLFALEDIPAGDPFLVDMSQRMYKPGFGLFGFEDFEFTENMKNEARKVSDPDDDDDDDDDDEEYDGEYEYINVEDRDPEEKEAGGSGATTGDEL